MHSMYYALQVYFSTKTCRLVFIKHSLSFSNDGKCSWALSMGKRHRLSMITVSCKVMMQHAHKNINTIIMQKETSTEKVLKKNIGIRDTKKDRTSCWHPLKCTAASLIHFDVQLENIVHLYQSSTAKWIRNAEVHYSGCQQLVPIFLWQLQIHCFPLKLLSVLVRS